jgi:uncharacterized protein with von Willebrand factor type A (vWA) domain
MKDSAPRGVAVATPNGSIATNVVEFCRLLHSCGIPVAPGSSEIALRAIGAIDLTRRAEFQSSLRICLLTKPEDIPLFTQLFNAYWKGDDNHDSVNPDQASLLEENKSAAKPPSADYELSPDAKDAIVVSASRQSEVEQDHESERSDNRSLASRRALSDPADVAQDSEPDVRELERIARALAKKLALRRSRRKESHRTGNTLDLRSILRKSLRHGGLPIELGWRRRRINRTRLIFLCDVSRSMEPYARMLLHFAAAVLRQAWRVDVFRFANDLTKMDSHWTDFNAIEIRPSTANIGAGTQIGSSFTQFLDYYPHCLTGNQSTIIILSDGLDAGEPETLRNSMTRLRRRARQIIWLNPLVATSGYEPTARGMAAALPLVDIFAAANDSASLWKMVERLKP